MAVSRCKVHAKQVSAKVAKNAKSTHTTLEALDKEATREILEGQHKKGRYHGNERENRVLYNYAHKECSAVEHGTLKAAVDKVLDDHSITKVRKDAVVAESMYCSVPDWREYTESEEEALVADLRADAESRGLLVVDIRLHLDEATPHLHITSVPIAWDDDRQKFKLAATKLMAYTTAEAMAWQEKMWMQVAEPRGYKRPDLGKSSTKAYVKKTSQEAAAARAEAKAAKEELTEINERLELARRLEETLDKGPVAIAAAGGRAAAECREAGKRAEVAAAGQKDLGAEIDELRARVAAAERECAAARNRERAARTRFGQLADRAREALKELGRLPQRVFNRLQEHTKALVRKLGFDPTLGGFGRLGQKVPVSVPSVYEQRQSRGVIVEWLESQPRKPGELKQAKDKPKYVPPESADLDKDAKLAAKVSQAQALDARNRSRGSHNRSDRDSL